MLSSTLRRALSTATPVYRATAVASGKGREGSVKTPVGFSTSLAYPKELGGPGNDATHLNPEILFACGYSSCFLGAVQVVASTKKIKIPASTSVAIGVDLLKSDAGFGLAAELTVTFSGLDQKVADEIAQAAHQVCPYSKATRGNIDVKVKAAV